jgi:hypothetical protein
MVKSSDRGVIRALIDLLGSTFMTMTRRTDRRELDEPNRKSSYHGRGNCVQAAVNHTTTHEVLVLRRLEGLQREE